VGAIIVPRVNGVVGQQAQTKRSQSRAQRGTTSDSRKSGDNTKWSSAAKFSYLSLPKVYQTSKERSSLFPGQTDVPSVAESQRALKTEVVGGAPTWCVLIKELNFLICPRQFSTRFAGKELLQHLRKPLHAACALPPPNACVGGYGQAIRAMFEYADSPAALAARTRYATA
jgi:hypothetical protein